MKIIIKANDDGYLASCPTIDGAFAEGNTEFEALCNLFDVIKMIKDFHKEHKKKKEIHLEKPLQFTIPITT